MRVLIAAMKMEQGGAETHVYELCRALAGRGFRVTLASSGGEWAERLKECGVSVVTIPMHKKTSLPRALFALLSLTGREKFDVMHAHARIPAFLCGIVSRLRGIPLAVTVHYPFRTGVLLSRLSEWGNASLAVSEEIRQYLYDSYSLPHGSVSVTVNGIDASRFAPRKTEKEEYTLFGAEAGCGHRLLTLCRLDRDADFAPRALIALYPRLKTLFPDLELLIAGDGDDAADLRKTAPRGVIFVGKTHEPERFLSLPGVFVGVSRAALEAMACGKTVILLGPRGYGGVLNEERAEEQEAMNFCASGMPFDEEILFSDLCETLALPPEALEKRGTANREIVLSRFSTARMADDAARVYARLTALRGDAGRVVIGGYVGAGNCGDEAIVSSIVSSLRQREDPPMITVLSRSPKDTARRHLVRSVCLFDPLGVYPALKRADLFVCGGALLTDAPSKRSLACYAHLLGAAKRSGCRVMLWAGGIGPLLCEKSEKTAKKALENVDLCAVRDGFSLEKARFSGVKEGDLRLFSDPVFALFAPDPGRISWLKRTLSLPENAFAVSLRRTEDTDSAWVRRLAALLSEMGGVPCFLPMQKDDLPLLRQVCRLCGGRVLPLLDANEIEGLLPCFTRLLAMRYHALLLGAKAGVPCACLSYDPKTDSLADALRVPRYEAGDLPGAFSFSRPDPTALSRLRADAKKPAHEAEKLLTLRRKR